MPAAKSAPVALFTYDRINTLRDTIAHLLQNPEACDTDLFIFSDGGRDEHSWKKVNIVRDYLHTIKGFKHIHLVERPHNLYLEQNVIQGINEVFQSFDRIIVMEDDVKTSKFFLKYMNDAFETYNDEPRVMHIAGFTNLSVPQKGDVYFTHHMTGSGAWGTWRDRWQSKFEYYNNKEEALLGLSSNDLDEIEYGGRFHCLQSLDRNPIPWDICWLINIKKNNGLCLHPTQTLARNIGLQQGTHFDFRNSRLWGHYNFDVEPVQRPICVKSEHIETDSGIESLYATALSNHGFVYNPLGRIARRLFYMFRKH